MATPHYPDQLVIALEPEAASIYCRRLRMSQLVPDTPPPMPPLTLERNKKLEMPEVVADYVEDHLKSGKLRLCFRTIMFLLPDHWLSIQLFHSNL